jgi:hypothetical protein
MGFVDSFTAAELFLGAFRLGPGGFDRHRLGHAGRLDARDHQSSRNDKRATDDGPKREGLGEEEGCEHDR